MRIKGGFSDRLYVHGKNFTLIELLVVIAIIAILASLLLPSLNRARDVAKGTRCVSNIKQMLLATIQYADDFNGQFISRTNNAVGYGYLTWLNILDNGTYIRNYSVCVCPAAAPRTWDTTNLERYSFIYAARRTTTFAAAYDPNNALVDVSDSASTGNAFNVLYLRRIRRSSDFVFYMDSWNAAANRKVQFYTVTSNANGTGIGVHHAGKANIGFMDGHVKGSTGDELQEFGVTGYYKNDVKIGG